MISKSEFDYHLPKELIAQEPLSDRSSSKLLKYQGGAITHHAFKDLATLLDQPYLWVFNNTKVIPARLFFKRQTGAVIEILLLNPLNLTTEEAMASSHPVQWETLIGGLKKWKDGEELNCVSEGVVCKALLTDREKKVVEFIWETPNSFAEVVRKIGNIPLPPYIERAVKENDHRRYQTVYARHDGAVAAPTAGLHFTPEVLNSLTIGDHQITELTLHVGAGTFMPMKTGDVLNHEMHEEAFDVSEETIRTLLYQTNRIAVGTTSLRVLESLYWVGVKLKNGLSSFNRISQDDYRQYRSDMTYEEALEEILQYMHSREIKSLTGSTGILISRANRPISIRALLTNFHLPQSTLLVLVEAVIGKDWKRVYQEAIDQEYRFLSYGDSNIYFFQE